MEGTITIRLNEEDLGKLTSILDAAVRSVGVTDGGHVCSCAAHIISKIDKAVAKKNDNDKD